VRSTALFAHFLRRIEMEKSLNSVEMARLWYEHPDWVLQLVVRNYNTLTFPRGNPENLRLSVHALLQEKLDGPYEENFYSSGGIDFAEFFGPEVTQYFLEGMRKVGPEDVVRFVEAYTREHHKLIGITHQEGGDPADASYTVLGLWENGVNALDALLEGCRNDRDLSPFSAAQRERMAFVVLFLCDERQWKLFRRELTMHYHGQRMSDREMEYLVRLGYAGVRSVGERAERKTSPSFPLLSLLPPGKLITHLLPRENFYDRPIESF
jgi:hypothetical protein